MNNTITGNTGEDTGGGISCQDSPNATISNNTICENNGYYGAGNPVDYSSRPSSTTLFCANRGGYGGGICCFDGSPIIADNTINDNFAYQGGGIYCRDPGQSSATTRSSGTPAAGSCA